MFLVRAVLVPERDVIEDEYLPFEVEVHGLGHREEIHQSISVLCRGPDGILFGAVVQYELERELAGRPTLLLVPIRMNVGDLAYLYLLFGLLFRRWPL